MIDSRFGTRRNYKRGTHSCDYFSSIIAACSLLYDAGSVQTPEIKTSSLLHLLFFVLIMFELSLCTAGSLFLISFFHTLHIIRKENQEWQFHLLPRPFSPKIFKAGSQKRCPHLPCLSTTLSITPRLTTKLTLALQGLPACYFCHSVFLRCYSIPPLPTTVHGTLSNQNTISKFFSLGLHLEKP